MFPELRFTASLRRLGVLATALLCIGCAAPAAESQVPSNHPNRHCIGERVRRCLTDSNSHV
jgi:hypothetical protein